MKRRPSSPAHRRQPRPLLLLWLVPLVWSLIGSSIHNPGACAGDRYCKLKSGERDCTGHHGEGAATEADTGLYCLPQEAPVRTACHHDHGDDAAERHHAEEPANPASLSAPVAVSGIGCFECQWISASALSLASSLQFHLLVREIETVFTTAHSLISASTPHAFSRGPPVAVTFLP